PEEHVLPPEAVEAARKARPAPEERQLLEVLLADAALVPVAKAVVAIEDVGHPGLQKMLRGLYDLHSRGIPPTLDELRASLEPAELASWVYRLHDVGVR